MNMGKIEVLLEALEKKVKSMEKEAAVVKETVKMTEAQKKAWKEVVTSREKTLKLKKETDFLVKQFWNKIEGELKEFDRDIRVNEDDTAFEIMEAACDCEDCK